MRQWLKGRRPRDARARAGGPRGREANPAEEPEHQARDLELIASENFGIRIGTPAVTTQGMRELEMGAITDFIALGVTGRGNPRVEVEARSEVAALTTLVDPERLS